MDSTRFVSTVGADTGSVEPTMAPPVERPRAEAPPSRSGFAANAVPLAVASALFMEFIDSTALSTALPTLARAFHTDPVHLKLALTSYLLALAVFAPASGWVADRFGAKRVFLSAMAVFLAGSVCCGLSHSLGQLVAARVLQGTGGAMMTPVGRLIVVDSAPRDRFVSAMAWFTMPALVGPLLGPPLAGLILGVASWSWIFYINIPVGALGMVAVALLVPDIRRSSPARFDSLGFAMAAVAIVALIAVSETAGTGLAPWPLEIVAALVGAGALVAFVRHVGRVAHPVLNLRLLKVPSFGASVTGGTLVRLGLGATPPAAAAAAADRAGMVAREGWPYDHLPGRRRPVAEAHCAGVAATRRLPPGADRLGRGNGRLRRLARLHPGEHAGSLHRAAVGRLRVPPQRPVHLLQRPQLRRHLAAGGEPGLHPGHRDPAGEHEPGRQHRGA